MRCVVASDSCAGPTCALTFRYKLIYNIAGNYLPYPIASDLYEAPAFQDLLNRTNAGQPTHWYRNFSSYLGTPRPRFELYDLLSDPEELDNLAGSAPWASTLAALTSDIRGWQNATNDDWAIKWIHE